MHHTRAVHRLYIQQSGRYVGEFSRHGDLRRSGAHDASVNGYFRSGNCRVGANFLSIERHIEYVLVAVARQAVFRLAQPRAAGRLSSSPAECPQPFDSDRLLRLKWDQSGTRRQGSH